MRVESNSIHLAAQYSRVTTTEERQSLSVSFGPAPRNAAVAISEAGQAAAEQAKAITAAEDAVNNDPRLILLRLLIEKFTGQKIDQLSIDAPTAQTEAASTPAPAQASLAYDYHARTTTEQQLSFSAEGVIRTQDGKEIRFQLAFNLASAQTEQVDISIRTGNAAKAKDPLILNFNGKAAALADTKFSFDLDSDGQTEQVAQLQSGSGFLALDKNKDGKINNGQELFGPTSGDGFADLAAYDSDHNQFIDEADAVFTQLRLFTPDAQGNSKLTSLKEAGVGALYLGKVTTPFEFNAGLLRSSSVFLNEDGSAGSLQQVDLKV